VKLYASILLASTLVGLASSAVWAFIPSTLFQEAVTASVALTPATNEFTYAYKIANSPHSTQSIADFGIEYKQADSSDLQLPSGWIAFRHFSGRNILLMAADDDHSIKPGSSLDGMTFKSRMLPSIVRYFSQSSYVYLTDDPDEQEAISLSEATDYFRNCKTGYTVGPGKIPTSNALDLISLMIQQKELSSSLGWIQSSGILTSLNIKLNKINRSISNGNTAFARNQTIALQNELAAQRNKAINQSAFTLLYTNSEYLLKLLR